MTHIPGIISSFPGGKSVSSIVGWSDRGTGIFYIGAGNEPTGTLTSFNYPFVGDLCGFRVSNTSRYLQQDYTPPTSPYPIDSNTIVQMDLEEDFLESNSLTVGTTGTPTLRTATPPGSYTGYTEFNGADWFGITVGAAEDLGDNFTIETWARRKNTVDTNSKIFGYGPISTAEQDTTLRFLTSDDFSFRFDNNPGPTPDVDLQMYSNGVTQNNWHYVSITCSKGGGDYVYSMHIDGFYTNIIKNL